MRCLHRRSARTACGEVGELSNQACQGPGQEASNGRATRSGWISVETRARESGAASDNGVAAGQRRGPRGVWARRAVTRPVPGCAVAHEMAICWRLVESWACVSRARDRDDGIDCCSCRPRAALQSRFAAPAGGERGAVHAAWQGRYDSPRLGSTRVESDSARQGRMTAVPGPDSGLGLEGGSTKVCRVAEHIQLIPFGRAVPCTIV